MTLELQRAVTTAWIVIALAAWGSPPRPRGQPRLDAGELQVAEDRVARRELDGAVVVTVHVSLDTASAAGVIRVPAMPLAAALRSPHVVLARARAWQLLAELAPAAAEEALARGSRELGATAHDRDGLRRAIARYAAQHRAEVR